MKVFFAIIVRNLCITMIWHNVIQNSYCVIFYYPVHDFVPTLSGSKIHVVPAHTGNHRHTTWLHTLAPRNFSATLSIHTIRWLKKRISFEMLAISFLPIRFL